MSIASIQEIDTSHKWIKKLRPWQLTLLKYIGLTLIVVLTILPILNITIILATTGADNLSNDYLQYVGLIDRILQGNYDWTHFFEDTYINSHALVFPILTVVGIAYFFHWNTYVELYLSIALEVVRMLLLFHIFTYYYKRPSRWLVLPALAALIFSSSQITRFSFGQSSLAFAINLLGFTIALWGLLRFWGRWMGVGLVVGGGILAAWSGAMGLIIWPLLLLGMLLFKYRRLSYYAVFVAGGLIAAAPYINLVLKPSRWTTPSGKFSPAYVVSAIGWPFSNGTGFVYDYTKNPAATTAGWIGIALLVTGIGLLITLGRNFTSLRWSYPALVLLIFGLVTILQVALFRTDIAPWYVTLYIHTWIGLVGLSYFHWVNRPAGTMRFKQVLRWAGPLWGLIFLVIFLGLYFGSNLTYEDKSFYLSSRAPSSAACLRNYQARPTFCEGRVFQWELGRPQLLYELAEPLERHRLSVFAPHQQWTLQGDYQFPNVRLEPGVAAGRISWSSDLTNNPADWTSYKHLNLVVPSPAGVLWTVYLPPTLEKAEFHSAVAISQSAHFASIAEGITFQIYLEQTNQPDKLIYSSVVKAEEHNWQELEISLKDYAGKTITLRLTSNSNGNPAQALAMYNYPYIDIDLPDKPLDAVVSRALAAPYLVTPSDADFRFDLTNPSLWSLSGMQPALPESNKWLVAFDPKLSYKPVLDLCLADYSHTYVKLAAPATNSFRVAQVYYQLKGQPGFDESHSFLIPLFPDAQMHEYSFDLKLLDLNPEARLAAIRLDPLPGEVNPKATFSTDNWVQLADFRMIRKPGPTTCH